MPEVEGEQEVSTELDIADLQKLAAIKDGEILDLSACQATRKGNTITITFCTVVIVEFDMGDFAPDNDWRD